MSKHPTFVTYLKQAIVEWQSAVNTEQRVKLKSAALLEMWLEEASRRMFDRSEKLGEKTELAKLLARLAGLGATNANTDGIADKINITITMGADKGVKVVHELPAKVIEGTVEPGPTSALP